MTLSASDLRRPARIAGLIAGLGVALCAYTGAAFAQMPSQPAPPAEEKEQTAPHQESAPSATAETDRESAAPQRRFYLGPDKSNDPQEPQAGNVADRAPTSILLGPYLPPDSIPLPDTGTRLTVEDGQTAGTLADDIFSESNTIGQNQQDLADAIAIDPLDRLDPADVGIWTDETPEAFPVTMWDGSRRAVLEVLLPALPTPQTSPTVKSLFRRLLLSPAIIPPALTPAQADDMAAIMGRSGTDNTTQTQHPILLARLNNLYTAGLIDDFLLLAGQIQPDVSDEDITRLHTNALLVKGDHDQACALARSAIGQSGAAFWLQTIAMCEALDGRRAAARLQLALLDDAGESDILFNTLTERLLAESENQGTDNANEWMPTATAPLSPILYALFRLSGTAIPDALALTAPTILLPSLAGNPDLDADTRLVLAERGAKSGLITGNALAAIYAGLTFTEAERQAVFASLEKANNPDTVSPGAALEDNNGAMASSFSPNVVTGPRLHALLWQQVARADSSAERMRWIEIAFEHGRKKGMAFAMAEALADPLSSVEASVSLGGYADSAGTIHLVNGHPAQAVAWQEAARLAADAGNADAQRAFSALSPLLFISSHDEATFYTPARLSEWWDQYEDTAPSIRLRQGDRLFTRLSDLGVDVPQTLLDAVLAAPAVTTTAPPAVLWRQLLQAIHHDRLGETVLTGLAAMDDKGLAYTHPALLSAIITGLRLTGLEEDARNLALETMIMDGF